MSSEAAGSGYRPPRRWPLALGTLLLGAAIGAGVLWWIDQNADEQADDAQVDDVRTTTVIAETRDLLAWDEWAGTLRSGTTEAVGASVRGTVTSNAEVGDELLVGDVIAEIDGAPVVALYGSVPQFRAMDVNTEPGEDIRQLEQNLVALGYDPDGTVTVDDDYTVNTGLMVERWETDLGFEEPDNVIDAGRIAFLAGPSEVIGRTPVGSQVQPGQPLLTATVRSTTGFLAVPSNVDAVDSFAIAGTALDTGDEFGLVMLGDELVPMILADEPDPERTDALEFESPGPVTVAEVVLDVYEGTEGGRPTHRWEVAQGTIELAVDVDDIDEFPLELAVQVELPDGELVDAAVAEVSDIARTIQAGQETITVVDVTIEPVEPLDSRFTDGPVVIRVETEAILDATVIPVRALIALAEGGHAVQIEGRGLVAVELGSFDDGWVEITNGAVSPGEALVAPA